MPIGPCHEGEVDYYDTFGGRIEAVGNVNISGSLVNVTVNTSDMSMQDMIDTMNTFITQRKAEGDPIMNGVPAVRTKTLDFTDSRTPDHIAPVEGDGTDIREVRAEDTGSETEVETGSGTPDIEIPEVDEVDQAVVETGSGTPAVETTNVRAVTRVEVEAGGETPLVTTTDVTNVPTLTVETGTGTPIIIPVKTDEFHTTIETPDIIDPVVMPTASVDELLAGGLTTLAETNPDFTDYANFITSNYMMDVGRLQYRDDLINNTDEPEAQDFGSSDYVAHIGSLDHLNKPVFVPKPDGSGMHTVYPEITPFELDGQGALIAGNTVTASGASISNAGTISAKEDLSLTGGLVTSSEGAILAEGDVSVTSLTSVLLEDTKISGNEIDIFAGQQVVGQGLTLDAASDVSISGSGGVTISGLENNFTIEQKRPSLFGAGNDNDKPNMVVTSTREVKDQQTSTLNVGGNLSIFTDGDLVVAGADVDVAGDVTLTAGNNLALTSVEVGSKTKSKNSKTEVSTSIVTDIDAGGSITATAGGDAILMGTQIDVGGQAQISAVDNLVLAAVQDIYSHYSKKKKSGFLSSKTTVKSETKVTNKGVSIASGDDLYLLAETGDLTTAGTSLASGEGDVNLTVAEGDLYAGAYTDVHSTYSKTSKSILGGLLGSTTIRNRVDEISRGTEALAAIDLSLISGEDTTLVGAVLSAGNNLNINTGGDFDVQAAINSLREEFFEHEMGLVLMTTITESSYVETAVLTQLLAGQTLNFDIGGEASLTLYELAGVDAQTAEELYPEELLAIAGLQILQEQLANEYFYDEQVALSPAFKALVAIAVGAFVAPAIVGAAFPGLASAASGTFMSALGSGLEAFTATVIVESLDGAVSGNFDIGDILTDAAFSGVTAGLTSGINLDTFGITSKTNPELFNSLLGDLGNGNLSVANILNGTLDNVISNGLSSAVYGTDFSSQLGLSMVRTVVNLAMADVQFEIGELGNGVDNWEGSFPHMVLHGLTGCASAEATGASCASGATAAVAQSIYAGVAQDSKPSRDNYSSDSEFENAHKEWRDNTVQTAGVLGALAGYVFSGGETQNVTTGENIATSGIANNYLYHAEAQEREQARSDCQAGDQAACQRVAELNALDQQRDQHLINVCGADIHGAACKSAFGDLTRAAFSYHSEPPALYETQQAYLEALGPEGAAGLLAEYTQMNKMLSILSADPELQQVAEVVLRSYFVENNGAGIRLITGVVEAGADAVYGMHSLAHIIATDPDQLRQAVAAIIDDPSLLPEAMWEPFKTRLDAGDMAGASGYALVAALEAVSGTKGTINLVKGVSTNVVDILQLRRTVGNINVTNRVSTGNSSVDDFVNNRSDRTNVDAEAGNPVGPQGRLFNAQELEDFAPTLAQRSPRTLSDGSIIDNQGFVYTRNANGSVTSRVANADQLSQSGQRLDFSSISTANPNLRVPQSATPRNQNEQLAFDYVRNNPQGGSGSTIRPLNSNDARFSVNGFGKFHQSVPGPNGQNISIHYQYNPTSGQIVDIKVTSPIGNAQ